MSRLNMNAIEVDGTVYGVGQVRQIIAAALRCERQVAAVRARHVKDPVTGRCLIDSEPYPCVTALDTGVQS